MKISFRIIICGLLAGLAAGWGGLNARAFSLLGPFEPWMNATNGFDPGDDADIGGPMCISNGYRWNVPVITYGFDPAFVNYFGTNGEAAVVSAINVLNSLPPASQMSPTNFPWNTTGQNFTAQAQGLLDLKSTTLYMLVEHLGLCAPNLGVYCLKSYGITNGVITGDVLWRNYDPVTRLPTPYVNDVFLTYQLYYGNVGGETNATVAVYSTDPFANGWTAVTEGMIAISPGTFFQGLTADDAGGLGYLLATNNVNYETLLPDVSGMGGAPIVNGAWRPGVDKISFVPQSVDASGNFLPTTNQYTDTYISNGVVQSQLVQRVTVQPDFLFCATNLPINPGDLYSRTGTTNWINNAALNGYPGGAGPGIIVPPVKIVFSQIGEMLVSANGNPPEQQNVNFTSAWGVFDGTTNPPIVCQPDNPASSQTTVAMQLYYNGSFFQQPYAWQMSGVTGTIYNFQSTTDLVNWATLFNVTNNGTANSWINDNPPGPQQFYRLAPQAN